LVGIVRKRKILLLARGALLDLRCWFHKFFYKLGAFDSDDGARLPLIRPLGCRGKRAPTWRIETCDYAAGRGSAAPISALIIFICILFTALFVPVY
jgi:hypothetical protein